jgi:hypothetical protein
MEKPEDGIDRPSSCQHSLLWNILKRVFLARWTMEMEDIQSLIKELEDIKQAESETVRAYWLLGSEKSLFQIPLGCRPKDRVPHLSFILMDFRYT